MNWYFQYVPGDMWDYDEAHTHILIDGQVGDQPRKLITHSARNGFLYTFERSNGQTLLAKPYVENINWTKGIDQKTGKPVDYDPNRDIQIYSGQQNQTLADPTKKLCPSMQGGNNYWPAAYSPKTKLLYIPSVSSCNEVTLDTKLSNKAGDWKGADVPEYRARRNRSHRRRSRSPATSRRRSASPIRTTAARSRPAAALSSPASPTAPSWLTTTPPWSRCGRSMSGPASTRRR